LCAARPAGRLCGDGRVTGRRDSQNRRRDDAKERVLRSHHFLLVSCSNHLLLPVWAKISGEIDHDEFSGQRDIARARARETLVSRAFQRVVEAMCPSN
jgi:hypothetical protein